MARAAELNVAVPRRVARRATWRSVAEERGWSSAWRPHDPVRWSIWLLVLLSVSRANGEFAFLTPLRPLMVLSALALGLLVVNPKLMSRLPWARTWPARVVMALGAAACLSAVFGISLGGSASFILDNYSKKLLLAFLVMATIRRPQDIHMYIWAYVLACGLLAGLALRGGVVHVAYNTGLARLNDFVSTYDGNDVGVVLLIGIPLAMYTFQMSRVRGKLVSLLIMLGIGYTLAKTGSRGAFVGLVATGAAIMVLVDSIGTAKKAGFILATLLALAVASPEGYWDQMKTILRPTEDYNWSSQTGRKAVIERGLGYMAQYPVFGIGAGNFPMAEGTLSEMARRSEPAVAWNAAHNSFLQAAVEMGIVGLILWCTLLCGLIVSIARLRRRLPSGWRLGSSDDRVLYHAVRYIPAAVIAFSTAGFFVSFAYLDPIYLLAAMAVGILALTGASHWAGTGSSPAVRANGGRFGGTDLQVYRAGVTRRRDAGLERISAERSGCQHPKRQRS